MKRVIVFLIPLLLVVSHLARRIHLWYQTEQEINQTKNRIAKLKQDNQSLNQKKEYYQSEEFIRREAREKLGMTRENELILLIPTPPDLSILKPKGEKYEQLPSWKQWWQLFFSPNNSLPHFDI